MASNIGRRAVRREANHCARAGSYKLPSVLCINCSILERSGSPVGGTTVEENGSGPQLLTNHYSFLVQIDCISALGILGSSVGIVQIRIQN